MRSDTHGTATIAAERGMTASEAACFRAVAEGYADADDWFPQPGNYAPGTRRALEICSSCPIQKECLAWALQISPTLHEYGGLWGIWGGTTAAQRDKMLRRGRLA